LEALGFWDPVSSGFLTMFCQRQRWFLRRRPWRWPFPPNTKPEEVKELQAWVGDRLVQEAGAQVMEADYNRIKP
jgi:hypothetical protein